MTKIEKVVRILCSYAVVPCVVALVGWVFVFVAYVIGRFIEIRWLFVEEFTGYWMVFIVYMPLAYGLMVEAHTKAAIVTSRLPEKARRILQVCTNSIGLVLVCCLLMRSINWLIHGAKLNLHSASSLHVLLWPIYLPISIGLILFALMFMVKLRHSVMELMRESQKEG